MTTGLTDTMAAKPTAWALALMGGKIPLKIMEKYVREIGPLVTKGRACGNTRGTTSRGSRGR